MRIGQDPLRARWRDETADDLPPEPSTGRDRRRRTARLELLLEVAHDEVLPLF
jgi:hypothetical protein